MSSLIPDETRQQIGQLMQDPVTVEITARESQRYAMAVDDLNPVYFDEDAARAAGYRTIVAPPTFMGHAVAVTKPLSQLREDGIFRGGRHLRLGVARVMAGGDDWEFVRPAYVGDVVTAETRLHSLDEHEGRSGPFVTTVVQTIFTDADGEVVARLRQTGIAR